VLNNRDDTPFWRFARNELACPDSLAERLELWRHKQPTAPDLPDRLALFSGWSYMYVLFSKKYFDGIRAIRDAPPMPWYRPEGPGTTGPQDGDRDGAATIA